MGILNKLQGECFTLKTAIRESNWVGRGNSKSISKKYCRNIFNISLETSYKVIQEYIKYISYLIVS